MSTEVSSVGKAVHALGQSLDLAEEAILHAVAAESRTVDTFAFYRRAFADSDSPLVESASRQANEAANLIRDGTALLANAKQEIRNFVREIAPGLALSDSGKIRATPSGEQLLNTSKRPRNIRELEAVIVREGEGVVGLGHQTLTTAQGLIDLFQPVSPGGVSTVAPASPAVTSSPPPGSAASGDVTLTALVLVVTTVKIVEVTIGRLKKRLVRGSEA